MKPCFSPSCDHSCMEMAVSWRYSLKKQSWWMNEKTIIESNSVIAIYRDLSLSHRWVIWSACHWQITEFCSTLSNNNPQEQHTCNTPQLYSWQYDQNCNGKTMTTCSITATRITDLKTVRTITKQWKLQIHSKTTKVYHAPKINQLQQKWLGAKIDTVG